MLPQKTKTQLYSDRTMRIGLARRSHFLFFHVYFSHYVKHPTARFHKELFSISEDEAIKNAVIVAFRGSAKSTIFTLSYPIWAVVGQQQKKFVILLSQTQYQAKLLLTNLKRELESNELLRNDFGPFEYPSDEWGSNSLVLPKYGARIIAASTEQSVRGLRHGQYRPDLIICDDVEDLSSVKTKEGRDKTFQFITGEVIPSGDQTTRLIVIGNLLHEDSLLMRLKKSILEDKLEGTFKAIPLLGDESKIVWPGKFPTMKEINVLKKNVASESAWQREYLLKIISDTDRLVHPEWIHYYEPEVLPSEQGNNFHYTATGVDVAISQRETADYTAMVSGKVFGYQDGDEDSFRVYILPHPVNEKLTFPQQVDRIKLVSKTLGNYPTKVFIEDVGYQAALIQHLENAGFPAEGVKTGGQDKRARLALTTAAIQSGKVLFPSKGCEDLILQLTGFGVEKHDDLADAFAVLMLKVLSHDYVVPRITWIDWNRGGFNFDDDDDFGMSGNWKRIF